MDHVWRFEQYAEKLVKEIKSLKRNLKLIYISHSYPGYYFALDVIKKNSPEVRIVSTAQTAYLIEASKDEKLAVWQPQLGEDAPSEIIVPEAVTSLPDLEELLSHRPQHLPFARRARQPLHQIACRL